MFVFGWKHKILIKRLLVNGCHAMAKLSLIGTELSLKQLVVAIEDYCYNLVKSRLSLHYNLSRHIQCKQYYNLRKQTNLSIYAHIRTYFHSVGQNMMKINKKTTQQILLSTAVCRESQFSIACIRYVYFSKGRRR